MFLRFFFIWQARHLFRFFQNVIFSIDGDGEQLINQNKYFRALRSQVGFSLVEVMVVSSVMIVIMLGMATMMANQRREAKSLNESLAQMDLEKLLISSLANGSICTTLLTTPQFTFDSTTVGACGSFCCI